VQSVVAIVKAKAEYVDAVKRAASALVKPSRADEGCLQYELYQSSDEPAVFIFYETWQSRQDIERHLQTPHALAFDEDTTGMLAEEEEIIYLEKIA
jgi:quinol monooxygenase YgiN